MAVSGSRGGEMAIRSLAVLAMLAWAGPVPARDVAPAPPPRLAQASKDAPAAPLTWRRYCNTRFGQCIDIPASFATDPPPYNNDGRVFRDGRGMVVRVWAMHNVLVPPQTLTGALDWELKRLPRPTYQVVQRDWFVISGIDDQEIYYLKRYVTKDVFSTLEIRYPRWHAAAYADIVTHISTSFTPAW